MSDVEIRRLERRALQGDNDAIRQLSAIARRNYGLIEGQAVLEMAFNRALQFAWDRADALRDETRQGAVSDFCYWARLWLATLELRNAILSEEPLRRPGYRSLNDMVFPIAAAHETRQRLLERMYA